MSEKQYLPLDSGETSQAAWLLDVISDYTPEHIDFLQMTESGDLRTTDGFRVHSWTPEDTDKFAAIKPGTYTVALYKDSNDEDYQRSVLELEPGVGEKPYPDLDKVMSNVQKPINNIADQQVYLSVHINPYQLAQTFSGFAIKDSETTAMVSRDIMHIKGAAHDGGFAEAVIMHVNPDGRKAKTPCAKIKRFE